MQFYDWLLFFHVGSAFALVAALVTFWSIAVAARNVDRPVDSLRYFKIAKPANILIVVGTMGTLIFGIWLAIDASAYQVWDGWVLIALALWLVAAGTGQRGGQTYAEAAKLAAELDGQRAGRPAERGASRQAPGPARHVAERRLVGRGGPDPHRHDLQAGGLTMLAAIRPDDWNFPLLVHVLGATLLVGGLVAAMTALLLGWRRDSQLYSRFGFRMLLFVALPAYLVMRIGAEWIHSKKNFPGTTSPAGSASAT